MTTSIHEELHHNHIVWKSELSQWRDDVALWKKEMYQAELQLKDLERALKAHREALDAHATSVQDRMLQTNKHESAIAAYEAGEAGEDLPAMAVAHEREVKSQDVQRQAHERIRRHHHSVMANWSLLLKAIDHQM